MNPIVAFVLGLLIGWLVEWVIDWFYWRRKSTTIQQVDTGVNDRSRVTELEQEIASYKNQIASLQSEQARAKTLETSAAAMGTRSAGPVMVEPVRKRDALDEIRGVSPDIEQRLNEAGIFTFADLAALIPLKLKEILGGLFLPPNGAVEMVQQARLRAGMIKKVDDLEVIVGIGPVIARALNDAGIFTFAQLATLTAADLREIVGEKIQRLADEDKLLAQARQLAEDQNRGG